MSQNLEELIEQAKQRNPIEQIIGETPGFSVTGHGRYLSCKGSDGHTIVIDTHNQAYHWHSRDEHGDVINWVEHRNNWDFKSTIEYLCKHAGLADPEWGKGSPSNRLAARARQDIYEVAVNVFTSLLWNNVEALAYPRARGWSDETIKRAFLGYSGHWDAKESVRERLHGEIVTSGGDPQSLAGVAMLGYKGNVRQWMIDNDLEINQDWVDAGHIPGLIGRDMLLYPHMFGGRCGYLSGRGIHDSKNRYNLPVVLAGPKIGYANWEWSGQVTQTVIVEGQADAITLAQLGIPAWALMGVSADEHTARMLGVGAANRAQVDFYVGLDADQAGNKKVDEIMRLFGPMTRKIIWRGIAGIDTYLDQTQEGNPERDVKDANDLLRGMIK